MTVLQAAFLGIVQGITEWLPVSSTAHLILVPWALGWWDPAHLSSEAAREHFVFDVLVQDGTLLAVLLYFRRDVLGIARAVLVGIRSRAPLATPEARMGWWLVLGTVPAVAVALAFREFIHGLHRQPLVVTGILLVATSILLLGERVGRRLRKTDDLRASDALLVGAAQAVAVLPGVSRSAATIAGGLLVGLERPAAARFSFLLSIPVLLGAGAHETLELVRDPAALERVPALAAGFVAAAVTGYATIHWLLGYLARRPLTVFAWYRIAAAAALFAVAWMRG